MVLIVVKGEPCIQCQPSLEKTIKEIPYLVLCSVKGIKVHGE